MEINNKAILVVLIAWLFFSLMALQGFYGINPDAITHKNMASDSENSPTYAPFLRSFSWAFVHNEAAWVFMIIFLFAVITPLLLVVITRDWIASWFYFSISSYFYFFIRVKSPSPNMFIFVTFASASTKNVTSSSCPRVRSHMVDMIFSNLVLKVSRYLCSRAAVG